MKVNLEKLQSPMTEWGGVEKMMTKKVQPGDTDDRQAAPRRSGDLLVPILRFMTNTEARQEERRHRCHSGADGIRAERKQRQE